MKRPEPDIREMKIADKKKYLENYSPFSDSVSRFNRKVECIHCGNKFVLNEYKVIRFMQTGKEFIVCKHYPECDGSIIDFFPATYNR